MDTATVDPDGTVRLLSAILAGVRPLPGASCVGHHELYDELHGGYGRRHRDQERERLARAAVAARRLSGAQAASRSPPSHGQDRSHPSR
ncbi:MAG: hypothetical protein M3Y48_15475 [Actinomycetota bacterium]|nr:hypothetical protein [Actinomycetota bacterium]